MTTIAMKTTTLRAKKAKNSKQKTFTQNVNNIAK